MKFVVFGGTGDLARKKLLPALDRLKRKYGFDVVAVGRRYRNEEEFRKDIGTDASYINADITKERIEIDDDEAIFYFALQPEMYPYAIEQVRNMNIKKKKVLIEKPFGYDYESAMKYHHMLKKVFRDDEIFHVDHYLAKEFIQNLLVLRFRNDILRSIWNTGFIDHIQIIVDEDAGIEKRLSFYNKVGAIKDMLQNHIIQIISLLLMHEPMENEQKAISYEKIRVIKSLEVRDVVRAKYTKELERESFVAAKIESSMFKYRDMPIYVRTGKRMKKKQALIYIQFKGINGNALLIEIQPEMRIEFIMNVRSWEGFRKVRMEYNHSKTIGMNTMDAYEYLIEQALRNDRRYFPTIDEILEAWKFVEKVEKFKKIEIAEGMPESAMEMIERDGRSWIA